MTRRVYVIVRSISFSESVGGLEKAAKDHILEMIRVGYQVILICPSQKLLGNVPQNLIYMDIPWPIWDKHKIFMTMGVAYNIWCRKVASFLNTQVSHNDILHFHGASAGIIGFLTESAINTSITVVNPHGMEEFGSGSILRLFNRFFTKRLIQKASLADAVIATDNLLVPAVKSNLGIIDGKIFIIPNTINIKKLREYIEYRISNEHSVHNDYLKIVSIGRIEYNKGYDILAKALSLFSSENPQYKLHWTHYGRGKKKELVLNLCKKGGVNISIVENATDYEVQNNLYNCDVFIQPSRYEGSSLTTLEAMVHGCLIIATPVGGIPDKIINYRTGFLSKDVTPESLNEILKIALHHENLSKIKECARSFVESTYDISVSTKKYIELYKSLEK
ncbi:TPA: glycosyltransferase family 4 protein [Klebsiella pneumoniae]